MVFQRGVGGERLWRRCLPARGRRRTRAKPDGWHFVFHDFSLFLFAVPVSGVLVPITSRLAPDRPG
jgi:hypothetical protein